MATFDYASSEPEDVRRGFEEIKRRAAAGPVDGLPMIGLLDLYNPNSGKVLSIALFETREDLKEGDATLGAMSAPGGVPAGRRVSVERTRWRSRSMHSRDLADFRAGYLV